MSNQALTAVSQYQTMHEDVSVRAEDKHASRSSKQGRVHQRTPLGFQREHLSSASWRMVEHTVGRLPHHRPVHLHPPDYMASTLAPLQTMVPRVHAQHRQGRDLVHGAGGGQQQGDAGGLDGLAGARPDQRPAGVIRFIKDGVRARCLEAARAST